MQDYVNEINAYTMTSILSKGDTGRYFEPIIERLLREPKTLETVMSLLSDKVDHSVLMSINKYLPISNPFYLTPFDRYTEKIKDILLGALFSNGSGISSVVIDGDVNYRELLSMGIIPHPNMYVSLDNHLIRILEGIPSILMSYMGNEGYKILSKVKVWSLVTEEYAKSVHTSFVAHTHPRLLYPSGRMKTGMSMFKTPMSMTYNNPPAIHRLRNGEYELDSCIVPVTRYAPSLTTGLYHGVPLKEYCGTFYYYEPYSDTLLRGCKTLVAETKCRAAQYLLLIVPNDSLEEVVGTYLDDYDPVMGQRWNDGDLKTNMMYTPIEAYEQLNYSESDLDPYTLPQIPIYLGSDLLYAQEDPFDQPLCASARELGYELVILTRMIGKYQVVSEVLDTRGRRESFANLTYKR